MKQKTVKMRQISQEIYKEIMQGIEEMPHLKKLKSIIGYCSPDEILSKGREFVVNGKYLEADIAFDELKKVDEYKELSGLYKKLILSLSSVKFRKRVKSRGYDAKSLVNNAFYCMIESTRMYANNEISKEDLFAIERLIDKIPFSEITFENRKEFEQTYNKFKEYNLEVFVK